MTHLDTQVALWLYYRLDRQISRPAQAQLAQARDLRLSPLVLVEIEILIEIGRVKLKTADLLLRDLQDRLDLALSDASMTAVSEAACRFAWTRDLFDRLIVANAMADGATLITADQMILRHFDKAVW
ncbi:type II toxin-antitoxin system VapC family toxin [Brevundimonas sp. SL130]|uniref:type II toxin-antitoxin system VapC family toxin n=1 Tax=Brevundimonas sp. SL130 TaxID=2995143 RepID=UPI00226C82EC|nr:PIN domain-containing protein [Brevundimonas sp. SL130]WAC60878.1 PIN domain-containing protein [Brevundimonas sp. SL130]